MASGPVCVMESSGAFLLPSLSNDGYQRTGCFSSTPGQKSGTVRETSDGAQDSAGEFSLVASGDGCHGKDVKSLSKTRDEQNGGVKEEKGGHTAKQQLRGQTLQTKQALEHIVRLREQLEEREAMVHAVLDSAMDWVLFPFHSNKHNEVGSDEENFGCGGEVFDEDFETPVKAFCGEVCVWEELDRDDEQRDPDMAPLGGVFSKSENKTHRLGMRKKITNRKYAHALEEEKKGVDEAVVLKRKRGRPKGSGKKNKSVEEANGFLSEKDAHGDVRGSPTTVLLLGGQGSLKDDEQGYSCEDDDIFHPCSDQQNKAPSSPASMTNAESNGSLLMRSISVKSAKSDVIDASPKASGVLKFRAEAESKVQSLKKVDTGSGTVHSPRTSTGRPRGRPRKHPRLKSQGAAGYGHLGGTDSDDGSGFADPNEGKVVIPALSLDGSALADSGDSQCVSGTSGEFPGSPLQKPKRGRPPKVKKATEMTDNDEMCYKRRKQSASSKDVFDTDHQEVQSIDVNPQLRDIQMTCTGTLLGSASLVELEAR